MSDTVKEQVNNTKNKTGVRAAAVLLLIAALLFSVWFMQTFMCIPFSCDEIRIINFHKEPENSIDVLLVDEASCREVPYEHCIDLAAREMGVLDGLHPGLDAERSE